MMYVPNLNAPEKVRKELHAWIAEIHKVRADCNRTVAECDKAERKALKMLEVVEAHKPVVVGRNGQPVAYKRSNLGPRRRDTRDAVLIKLSEMTPPFTTDQVVQAFVGSEWRIGQIRAALSILAKEGAIKRVKRGVYEWDTSGDPVE